MYGWDELSIGPVPGDEDCQQVGTAGYDRDMAMRECRAHIEAIKKFCGEPPEGAILRVKSFPHDFGAYYDVVCQFDGNNSAAVEYAYKCEGEGPRTWEDAGMSAPEAVRGRGR